MPTAADEFDPPRALLQGVVAACIAPRLERIESELGRPLAGAMKVWVANRPTQSEHQVASESADALQFEGRARFRKTGDLSRTVFSCHVLTLGAPGGYSGFVVRGHTQNGKAVAESHTVLHGSGEWLKW